MKKNMFFGIVIFILSVSCNTKNQSFTNFIVDLERASISKRSIIVQNYLKNAISIPVIEDSTKAHFVYFGDAKEILIKAILQIDGKYSCCICSKISFIPKLYV